jgi:hypothetical protein
LRRWSLALVLAVTAGFLFAGCQTSQDKARDLAARAQANAPKPLVIAKQNPDVKVVDTTLLSDQNGDAVVVTLKNEGKDTLVNVPILIDLHAGKKSVYRNDEPGLEAALNHVPAIEPGETVDWVNDQLNPISKPDSAKVKVGIPEEPAPAKLPEIATSPPHLQSTSLGPKVAGSVTNKSQIDQLKLVLFAVARSGGRVVAAGRGGVKKLKAGDGHAYSLFFIGNPTGGDVTVTAPPTTFK